MRKAFKWIFAILVVASVFCGVGCKPEVEVKPAEKKTGTIQGKAFYSNENVDNHSGIQITLVSTDGLRSVAYCESRGIATNARSVSDIKTTSEDGSYSFENIPVGTYTIWASSRNSVEEAIETNVNVRANEVVTANDLNLVATGNIKGTITIDGKTDGTLGLDVFIAGTSYVAKVGKTGNYEISKVPAGKGYMLCVQKGEYTTIINEDLEVKAKETIEVGCKNLLSEDWAIENEAQTNPTFKWLGEFEKEPENPDLYDAYYNTTDGCSYIWNGNDWDLLAKSGEDGADGEDGKDGVDGLSIVWKGELEAAPENPELYWAYYNIIDGCSYIWNGSSWDLLTQHANHTFNEWTVVTAPTCETEGKEERACTVCLYKEEKSIQTIDHTYGTWNVTTEPTTNAQGKNQRTCSNCGYVDSVVLQPAPKGFRFVKGTTITGTEIWTPKSYVFVSERKLTIPDLIVSDHEVTRGEYKAVMGSDPSYTSAYDKDGNELEGDDVLNNPVTYVNWYDALVYCNKLSMQENLTPCYSIGGSPNPEEWGAVPTLENATWDAATCDFEANGYRLPTEAEWEWLARGGENYKYAGSDTIDDVAWTYSNTNGTGTRDVKTKAPNGYGLYDMSGNVWEWCWDWYGNISSSTAADGAASSFYRVFRGGSWDGRSIFAPVSSRYFKFWPNDRSYNLGFRVVRQAN